MRSVAAPVFNLHPRDPRLARWLENYPPSLFNENLYQSIELMERYSIDLAIDLLGRLNVLERLDQSRSARDLCHTLSFQTRFASTLSWLLERLVETGCIEVQKANADRSYRLRCSPCNRNAPSYARLLLRLTAPMRQPWTSSIMLQIFTHSSLPENKTVNRGYFCRKE